MRQAFFTIIISLFLLNICKGQIAINPYFWDQVQSYNPASTGAQVDESVQMSITSIYSSERRLVVDNYDFIFFPVIPYRVTPPSIFEVKNVQYLAYQKTHTFKAKNKLTFGFQFKNSENNTLSIQESTSYGLTSSFHIPKIINSSKEKLWSFGLQMNLLFRRPNQVVVESIYREAQKLAPEIDLTKFESQFRDIGTHSTIGVSYQIHKYDKSLLTLGANYIHIRYNVARSKNEIKETYNLYKSFSEFFRMNLGYQHVFKYKFMMEFNFLLGLSASEYRPGIGGSFRIGNECILRISAQTGADSRTFDLFTFGVSVDHKNFTYHLSFTNYEHDTSHNNVAQLGIIYKFNKNHSPTLLRMNN